MTKSVKEMGQQIGEIGLWQSEKGMCFEVLIDDARTVFGRVDLHVIPIAGKGSSWVSQDMVRKV